MRALFTSCEWPLDRHGPSLKALRHRIEKLRGILFRRGRASLAVGNSAVLVALTTVAMAAASCPAMPLDTSDTPDAQMRECVQRYLQIMDRIIACRTFTLVESIEQYSYTQGVMEKTHVYSSSTFKRDHDNYYITKRTGRANDVDLGGVSASDPGREERWEVIVSNNAYGALRYIESRGSATALWNDDKKSVGALGHETAFDQACGWIKADGVYIRDVLQTALESGTLVANDITEDRVEIAIDVDGAGSYLVVLDRIDGTLMRFTYRKGIGDRLGNDVLGDPDTPDTWTYEVSDLEYDKGGTVPYPRAAKCRLDLVYDTASYRTELFCNIVEYTQCKTGSCGLREVPDIPDGTMVKRAGDYGDSYYQWQNGTIVPSIDRRLAATIDDEVSRIAEGELITKNLDGRYHEQATEVKGRPSRSAVVFGYLLASFSIAGILALGTTLLNVHLRRGG